MVGIYTYIHCLSYIAHSENQNTTNKYEQQYLFLCSFLYTISTLWVCFRFWWTTRSRSTIIRIIQCQIFFFTSCFLFVSLILIILSSNILFRVNFFFSSLRHYAILTSLERISYFLSLLFSSILFSAPFSLDKRDVILTVIEKRQRFGHHIYTSECYIPSVLFLNSALLRLPANAHFL